MNSTVAYYRVDRRNMAFLKFIVESYEGVALMSTLDPAAGVMQFRIAPGCEDSFERIVADLGKTMRIEHAYPDGWGLI